MNTKPDLLETTFQQKLAGAIGVLRGEKQPVTQGMVQLVSSYSQEHRYYHDLEHINTLVVPLRATGDDEILDALGSPDAGQEAKYNALKIIAALGHDCVYKSSDSGLGVCDSILEPYLNAGPLSADEQQVLHIVQGVFGVTKETLVPGELSNEFLSALATATLLKEQKVADKDIIYVVAQIKATEPFKEQADYIQLRDRLGKLEKSSSIPGLKEEIDQIVTLSTHFSNEDVKNFRGPLIAFIRNSFRIAPELNPKLREKNPTPEAFVRILKSEQGSMETFGKIAHRIFHSDGQGYPAPETLEAYEAKVKENTALAGEYMRTKQVSASYLQALVEKLGHSDVTLKEFLPAPIFPHKEIHSDDPIYQALQGEGFNEIKTRNANGEEVRFDIAESPLTQCFWEHLGKEKLLEISDNLQGYVSQVAKGEVNQSAIKTPMDVLEFLNQEAGKPLMEGIYNSIEEGVKKGTKPQMMGMALRKHRNEILPPDGTVKVNVVGF